MMPALIACTSSPMPGTSTTTVTCASARDLDFVLAHADGFDQHYVRARGVEQRHQIRGGARQSAQRAARGHRADEDARDRRDAPACGCGRRGARRPVMRLRGVDGDDRRPSCPGARKCAARRSTSVLLPAPGGPVMPIDSARARACAQLAAATSRACGVAVLDAVAARASARVSPSRDLRAIAHQLSGAAARSPGAGSRWCLRRWCTA